MKTLSLALMEPYEIENRLPEKIVGVQFGDDAVLLGVFDRLLDGQGAGLAAVQVRAEGHAAALKEQDGLYTVFTRSEGESENVREERVVQTVRAAYHPDRDAEALTALAGDGGLRFAVFRTDAEDSDGTRARAVLILARFLAERCRRGGSPLPVIVFGEEADCAEALKTELCAAGACLECDGLDAFLAECRYFPALADTLCERAEAEEALRFCRAMNYKDAMVHICDGAARVVIQADAAFRAEFPWENIEYTDDITEAFALKQRIFDTGLALLGSVGLFRGAVTLTDCLKDEAMREWLGRAFFDEILPYLPFEKEKASAALIAAYGRYGDGANANRLENCARGLIGKLRRGVIPAIRAYEKENFELPDKLTAALSAAILLLSDARIRDGMWTVIPAKEPTALREPAEVLNAFSKLSSDMPADALAYAALSDRELWGCDLRDIEGLTEAVARNLEN